MAKPRKAEEKAFELPDNYVPTFSASLPEWANQVTIDLVKNTDFKGSPGFDPGPEQARQVEQMTSLGMGALDICAILRIEPKLLEKFYKYELLTASARLNNAVAKVALQQALSGALPQSTQFWLKTRAGWKETKVTELTGANGGPVEFAAVKRRMLDAIEAEITDVVIEDEESNE